MSVLHAINMYLYEHIAADELALVLPNTQTLAYEKSVRLQASFLNAYRTMSYNYLVCDVILRQRHVTDHYKSLPTTN